MDGLRALAFLLVFGTHYLNLPWGWAGVDIFFVLSGFLITGILFDTRHQPHRVYNFYLRRTLRIFPLYYGLFLLIVLVEPVFHWYWNWHWLAWPLYLGNFARAWHPYAASSALQRLADAKLLSLRYPTIDLNMGHFWSLCVEEQFYLIWPWLVFWIKDRRKLLFLCAAGVVVSSGLRIGAAHVLPAWMLSQEVLYRATPFRMDALLLGGFIALFLRGPGKEKLLPAARLLFALLSGALFLWLALFPAARHSPIGYVYPKWEFTFGLSFIDLFSACLIVMALHTTSWTGRLLSWTPLRWLGGISYGAYVFHDLPHMTLLYCIPPTISHFRLLISAIAFAFTLIVSWASFRWFESPFIRLKDRLTRRDRRPSAIEMVAP